MNNKLIYKKFHATISYDADAGILRGEVDGINDTVTFEVDDISKVEEEFHATIDEYLKIRDEIRDDIMKRMGELKKDSGRKIRFSSYALEKFLREA